MAKRFTDTGIWEEDWFLDMPNEYKLFWFYMLAKCDHAGLFKANTKAFRNLVERVDFTSTEALRLFNNGKERVRVVSENTWFIEEFIVYQYGTTLNLNSSVHNSVASLLEKQKIEIKNLKGLLTLKPRDKDKDKDIKRESMRERGKNGKPETGVQFSEDGEKVIFADGSERELGESQKALKKMGQLKPKDVFRELKPY